MIVKNNFINLTYALDLKKEETCSFIPLKMGKLFGLEADFLQTSQDGLGSYILKF